MPTLAPLELGEAPGPAALIADAVKHPDGDPPLMHDSPVDTEDETEAETETETEESGNVTPLSEEEEGSVPLTFAVGQVGLRLTQSLGPSRARATTTITTISEEPQSGGVTTTETITHFGASRISTTLSSDGSFRLKPIPAKTNQSKKIKTRRTHTFEPRISHFDRDNPSSQKDPFRGFYTLFWIVIAVGAVRTLVNHYTTTGIPLSFRFATLISRDAQVLALSDAVMAGSTFLCVPFIQLVNRGWIRYYYTGLIIQHVAQTIFLGLAVRWTFFREWPWVQSGFMTLHTLSMLMKVHSYCSYNGELSEKKREIEGNEKRLKVLIGGEEGGKEGVEKRAKEVWEKESGSAIGVESGNGNGTTTTTTTGIKVKDFESVGLVRRRSTTTIKLPSSPTLSSRPLSPSLPPSSPNPPSSSSSANKNKPRHRRNSTTSERTHLTHLEILTWSPNSEIARLASDTLELRDALISSGVKRVQFPDNVGWTNFLDYLFLPTLVYQLEYPRTPRIRPMYVIEKTLATFGTFSLLVLIVEHYILPISPSAHQNSFFVTTLDLAMPFMINYLLIFYIIFECICNVFAELTRFADREFYGDWWNSTSFDEFSRKWNVPVHSFLLRHVYASTIDTYHFSKFQAAFATFLLSALVHELVMAVVTKKIRAYLFVMQMAQLPLIMFGRLPVFKRYPALGNLFFWIGLLSGFPLLAVAYIRF